jgi:DNA transformation protein
MSEQQDFATHIVDLLEPFGYCEARRMLGGYGIFHQELMFGLITRGSLYLEADAESRADFVAEGSSAFSYLKKNRAYPLSCYLAPDGFFEGGLAGLRWARLAFDTALHNPARHRKKNS